MKKLLLILPLVLVLCFTFSCQLRKERAEEPAVDIAAEREAVLAVNTAFLEAVKAKDINRLMLVFANDAIETNGDTSFRDLDGIRQMFENAFAKEGQSTSWEVEKVEVSQSGDWAYTLIKLDTTIEKEDQTVEHVKWGNLNLYKKQLDGSWKIAVF
jgi:uncharacterized protein (TIGR02246 family)